MHPSVCRSAAAVLLAAAIGLSLTPSAWAFTAAGLEDLKALALEHPDSALLCAQIASVCFAEGTISGRLQAASYVKQALGLDPTCADYHLLLAEIYFAGTYWSYGVRELQRAVTISPGSAAARTRLGKAYLDRAIEEWQMTRFKQARQELKRALSIDTGLTEAANLLALCNFDLGQPDSALALISRLPEDSLNVDALLLVGMARFENRQVDAAGEAFQRALAMMDNPRRRRYLARGFWTADPAAPETKSVDAAVLSGDSPGTAFLTYLWKRDDPDPATPVNERLVEHLTRVSFADFNFSVPRLGRPGSETTRGEVYCRYGRPVRWYFDPFGTNTFAGETVSPGGSDGLGLEDPFANLASIYKPTPLRVRKPRWVWSYEDFTLSFEDTHLSGDYSFPYEQDWSAYVDAYLKKNLPAVYESEIRTRMRVAMDVVNRLDDQGQPVAKVVFACDTRGVEYAPGVSLPGGQFEVQIAFLDDAYRELASASFRADLSADSASLSLTRLVLASSWQARPPAGTAVTALSLKSAANGAVGYAVAEFRPRPFGKRLEASDVEIQVGANRAAAPSRAFRGRPEIFLAFDVYNVTLDAGGTGRIEVSHRVTARAAPPPLVTRFLRSLIGHETGQAGRQVPAVSGTETLTTSTDRVHHVIAVEVASLVEGQYDIQIEVCDPAGRDTTTTASVITLSDSSE